MTDAGSSAQKRAGVRLEDITHRYGQLTAVDDLSLIVDPGSFVSLLGPSGCGKSTTLRIVAGFESPTAGRVYIGDKEVTDLEARRRPTAMVFQNYALFPHMTVGENVAYGLKVRKMDRSAIKERVREVLKRVDLAGYSDTPVTDLSGGQQQRAALARAIAVEPEVLLFDEPLSNLDVALRHQTRRELKMLQHRLGITSVYVTHDQEEALSLSDHVAVMRAGRIVQQGPPRDLYRNPETAFVASFLGGGNVLRDEAALRVAEGPLDDGTALSVRSEDILLSAEGPYEGRIRSTQFLGSLTEAIIEWNSIELRCMTPDAVQTGEAVRFAIREMRVVRDDA